MYRSKYIFTEKWYATAPPEMFYDINLFLKHIIVKKCELYTYNDNIGLIAITYMWYTGISNIFMLNLE